MSNVGYATITIIPSAKGFGSALAGDVDPAVRRTATSASATLTGAFTGAIGSIVKVGAAATGVVVGLAGALSIKGGIARQLQIEDATAKLTGLGNSADTVKTIMDSALGAVRGTAFGLGDAATVAASAVAAGIEPGQALQRTLSLVADAATIAGTDMGSMGQIFNKVASTGKIQGEVIAQLGERGIPILQLLAKELGVSAAEVSALASSGAIDFATFQNAMEAGMGGAALKSGETTRGALANMKAAFSRFGVALTSGFFPLFKDVFGQITIIMDGITAKITPFSEAFGAAFQERAGPIIASFGENVLGVLDRVSTVLGNFGAAVLPSITAVSDGFANMGAALGPIIGGLLGALGPLLGNLTGQQAAFAGITGPVGIVVGLFAALLASSPALQSAISGAFTMIAGVVGQALAALAPSLTTIVGVFGQLLGILGDALAPVLTLVAGVLVDVLAAALPSITSLVETFASILTQVAPILAEILGAVVPLVGELLGALAPILTELIGSILPPVAALFAALVPAIMPVIRTLADLLIPVIEMLMPIVVLVFGVVGDVIKGLMPVVEIVFGVIVNVISAAMTIIQGVIEVVSGLIEGDWEKFWGGIGKILSGAWDLIVSVLKGALDLVVSLFANIIPTLWNAGVNLVNGLIEGIKSVAGNIAEAILGPIRGAVEGVKSFLGIKSPSRLFIAIGEDTGAGMAVGLRNSAGLIEDASDALIPTIPTVSSPTVRPGGVAGAIADAAGVRGDHFSVEYNDYSTSTEDKEAKLMRAQTALEQRVAARRG